MKKQEVEIGNRSIIDIIPEPDILGLDEVVVTAYFDITVDEGTFGRYQFYFTRNP